ncbi:MAG: twin-arginine translocase subunit TatB [Alphaproteobacteria bacterium]|nr:twin-arginine translocase subunit TatB [Alphaproteobacteria bacterium]
MLDVGWQELFIIAVITIIVVGPKEIPKVLRTVTSWMRRIKEMAREFQNGIDDIARESELAEIRRDLEASANVGLDGTLENIMDPTGEISSDLYDLQKASEDLSLQQEEISARKAEIESQREALELEEAAEYSPPEEESEITTTADASPKDIPEDEASKSEDETSKSTNAVPDSEQSSEARR